MQRGRSLTRTPWLQALTIGILLVIIFASIAGIVQLTQPSHAAQAATCVQTTSTGTMQTTSTTGTQATPSSTGQTTPTDGVSTGNTTSTIATTTAPTDVQATATPMLIVPTPIGAQAQATAIVAQAQATATAIVTQAQGTVTPTSTGTSIVAQAQATATAIVTQAQATTTPTSTAMPTMTATTTATSTPTPIVTATMTPTATATTTGMPTASISPYLFGTNLGLFNQQDQVLTSSATQALLQQLHVSMIRMPVRTTIPASVLMQMAQIIKCIGATPLVILRGSRDATALADDVAVVQEMNQVYGHQTVYYEFGNEDDLAGSSVTTYTAAWNQVIPQVQKVALHGQFIGPVNFQYNHNYLSTFLQQAHPRPDAVSWHEYTCSYKWAANVCLSNIDHWNTHISDARAVMQSTTGTSLPIMITEWNYAPDQTLQGNGQPFSDGKWNNASFMTAWTTKALQTLITNHVFAAAQYSVTNTALPLIDSANTITTQGQVFASMYVAHQTQLSAPPS